jgi:Ca2+-binding RTX toxin-like protein
MQHRDAHPSNEPFHAVEPLEPRTFLDAVLGKDSILRVTGTRKADTIFVTNGPDARDTIFVSVNKEQFAFPTGDVTGIRIQAGALGDHVEFRGFATNNELFEKPATIYGSTGDDFILGPGSTSRIYGGTGNDKVFAGFSRDTVYGEEGNDTVDGGQGNDFLSGGLDNDHITGGLGIDRMFGDDGRDTFIGGNDLPEAREQPFEFTLDDRFLPQRTFDLIDGGAGKDRADADDGVDRLISIEQRFTNR